MCSTGFGSLIPGYGITIIACKLLKNMLWRALKCFNMTRNYDMVETKSFICLWQQLLRNLLYCTLAVAVWHFPGILIYIVPVENYSYEVDDSVSLVFSHVVKPCDDVMGYPAQNVYI